MLCDLTIYRMLKSQPALKKRTGKKKSAVVIVSCAEDAKTARKRKALLKLRAGGIHVMTANFILSGALKQNLDFKNNTLSLK